MTKNILFYLDGMMGWAKLTKAERDWVVINHPDKAPLGAWSDMMAD